MIWRIFIFGCIVIFRAHFCTNILGIVFYILSQRHFCYGVVKAFVKYSKICKQMWIALLFKDLSLCNTTFKVYWIFRCTQVKLSKLVHSYLLGFFWSFIWTWWGLVQVFHKLFGGLCPAQAVISPTNSISISSIVIL